MRSLRLSLRWGHGDLGWFDGLSREDQALVLAFERCESEDITAARKAAMHRPRQPGRR